MLASYSLSFPPRAFSAGPISFSSIITERIPVFPTSGRWSGRWSWFLRGRKWGYSWSAGLSLASFLAAGLSQGHPERLKWRYLRISLSRKVILGLMWIFPLSRRLLCRREEFLRHWERNQKVCLWDWKAIGILSICESSWRGLVFHGMIIFWVFVGFVCVRVA